MKQQTKEAQKQWNFMKEYAREHPLKVKPQKTIEQILVDREERLSNQ